MTQPKPRKPTDYARDVSNAEFTILKQHKPLNPRAQDTLLATSEKLLSATFPNRPIRWCSLYKRVLKRSMTSDELLVIDAGARNHRHDLEVIRAQLDASHRRNRDLENQVDALVHLKQAKPVRLKIATRKLRSGRIIKEAVPHLCISDGHPAEVIDRKKVNGYNEFNPEICAKRMAALFHNFLDRVEMYQQSMDIKRVVIGLNGDMTNGELRAESTATNSMGPIDECFFIAGLLYGGFDLLLNAGLALQIQVLYGNHSRLTHKLEYKRLKETSIEYLLARLISDKYGDKCDVRIADGEQMISECFGFKTRWLHGFGIKYGGNVGGLATTLGGKLDRVWNKAEHCDLTVVAHFHQYLREAPRGCLVNGSICGTNEYSLMKFGHQEPMQASWVVSATRGRVFDTPIFVD